jgi:pentatricopeptide repeat protein
MSFDPWNTFLKIWDSIGIPIPEMGTHLGVCGFIPSHSWECKCDSWVTLSNHTFPCVCFNHEPKVKVVTTMILGTCEMWIKAQNIETIATNTTRRCATSSIIFVGVLNAWTNMVALEEGECVHKQIIECEWNSNVFVCNSLVDMYAKCGSIEGAWRMFKKMPFQDVVTWTTIILGHAQCGQTQRHWNYFSKCN